MTGTAKEIAAQLRDCIKRGDFEKARKVLRMQPAPEDIQNIENEFRVGPVADSVTSGHEDLALLLIALGFSFDKDYKDRYLQPCHDCYRCRQGVPADCDDLQEKTEVVRILPEAESRRMSTLTQFLKDFNSGLKHPEEALQCLK